LRSLSQNYPTQKECDTLSSSLSTAKKKKYIFIYVYIYIYVQVSVDKEAVNVFLLATIVDTKGEVLPWESDVWVL
jgi:hypothetical protein